MNLLKKLFKYTKAATFSHPVKAKVVVVGMSRSAYWPLESSILLNIDHAKMDAENIYAYPTFLLNLIYHIVSKNIGVQDAYYLTLIQTIDPVLAITVIDNNNMFYMLSKYHKTRYISIQNGVRFSVKNNVKCMQVFYTFGEFEKDLYEHTYGIQIKEHHPVGSLRLGLFIEKYRFKYSFNEEFEYDICYPSIYKKIFIMSGEMSLLHDKIFDHLFRIINERNLKLCIALRNSMSSVDYSDEVSYYKNKLGDKNIKLIPKEDDFSSYHAMMRSKIVLGTHSTLLYEAVGLRHKVLFVNYEGQTNLDWYDFPADENSINVCKSDQYTVFKKKIKSIIEIAYDDYAFLIEDKARFLMNIDNECLPQEAIRKDILKQL